MGRLGLPWRIWGLFFRSPLPGEWLFWRKRGCGASESCRREVLSFCRAGKGRGGAFQSLRPSDPRQEAFSFAMAELIQKKLQGEVEKYQQLQKGKSGGGEGVRSQV